MTLNFQSGALNLVSLGNRIPFEHILSAHHTLKVITATKVKLQSDE